jgi:hypothetical protein
MPDAMSRQEELAGKLVAVQNSDWLDAAGCDDLFIITLGEKIHRHISGTVLSDDDIDIMIELCDHIAAAHGVRLVHPDRDGGA